MFSVLIQNKKTMDVFHEFHPLFLEDLEDSIGTCRWLESGTTLDTALPELDGLVNDKDEWRAVIVRVEDEEEMAGFASDAENPYDFLVNKASHAGVLESPVPLIRLTHMLGGVPTPEVEYESRQITDQSMAGRSVYVPVKSAEKEKEYEELVTKYEYDGRLPREIILITLRRQRRDKRDILPKVVWENPLETDSSKFWKRNNYPSQCRFVVYDYKKEGAIQKEADLFKFWTSVLLLATNDIDPSSLQAYKLYTIDVHFNKQTMTDAFQKKEFLLMDMQNSIRVEINNEIKKRSAKKTVPDYTVRVPVNAEYPGEKDITIDPGEFKLCSRSQALERKQWDRLSGAAETKLKNLFRGAERVLDESADSIRFVSKFPESDMVPLDRFQKEDMEEELVTIYNEILEESNALQEMEKRNRGNELSGEIRNKINARIYTACALEGVLLLVVLTVLAFLPAIVFQLMFKVGNAGGGAAVLAMFLVGLLLTGLVVLIVQRHKFLKDIKKYNNEMEDNAAALAQNISSFTKFASNIASYARGRRYARVMRQKQEREENSFTGLQRHLRASALLLERLKTWSGAFYLEIASEEKIFSDAFYELELPPRLNPIYSLKSEKTTRVPLNETGVYLLSPLDFVEKIEISREELYEDGRSSD